MSRLCDTYCDLLRAYNSRQWLETQFPDGIYRIAQARRVVLIDSRVEPGTLRRLRRFSDFGRQRENMPLRPANFGGAVRDNTTSLRNQVKNHV